MQDSNHKWDDIALVVTGDGGEAPQRFAFRIASKRVASLVQEAAGRKVKARLARERVVRIGRLMGHAMNHFAATMVDGGSEAPPLPGNPLSVGSDVLLVVAQHHMYLADTKTNAIVAGWKSEQLVGWHVTLHARTLTLSVLIGSQELSAAESRNPAFAEPVHFTIAMKDDPDVVSGVIQARVRALFAELRLRRMAVAQWDANFAVQVSLLLPCSKWIAVVHRLSFAFDIQWAHARLRSLFDTLFPVSALVACAYVRIN